MNRQALIDKNEARWIDTECNQDALKRARSVAKRLVAAKDRYLPISTRTGVPWFVIAVIHERESGQRWDRSLAQGDPWNKVSTHVPKGRGPFASFEDAAYDALVNCAPQAAKWSDWSAGGTMTILEMYNGLGYANKGRPSPYIWAGTNQYVSGKYVADGVYDPNAVDQQLGCATLIKAMGDIDSSISFDKIVDETPPEITPDEEKVSEPKAGPVGNSVETKSVTQSTTVWASLASVVATIGGALTDWKVAAVFVVAGIAAYIIYERIRKEDIKGVI